MTLSILLVSMPPKAAQKKKINITMYHRTFTKDFGVKNYALCRIVLTDSIYFSLKININSSFPWNFQNQQKKCRFSRILNPTKKVSVYLKTESVGSDTFFVVKKRSGRCGRFKKLFAIQNRKNL